VLRGRILQRAYRRASTLEGCGLQPGGGITAHNSDPDARSGKLLKSLQIDPPSRVQKAQPTLKIRFVLALALRLRASQPYPRVENVEPAGFSDCRHFAYGRRVRR
jgi:hypothetical protein